MRRTVRGVVLLCVALEVCVVLACGSSGKEPAARADASTDTTEGDGQAASTVGDSGSSGDSGTGVQEASSPDPNLHCSSQGNTFEGGPLGSCSLCTDEAGSFAGAPAGSCNGAPCGGGCTCFSLYGLQCFCPDLQAQTDDGSSRYCIALSCGSIICDTACRCTDPAHGTCECPVDGGAD